MTIIDKGSNAAERRRFIKGVLSVAAVFSLGRIGLGNTSYEDDILNRSYLINPAYTDYIDTDGELILETFLPDGTRWFIKCDELGKDVIQLIQKGENIRNNVFVLAEKYHLTEETVLSESTSIMEKLFKEGVLIDRESKITIVENVVNETEKK